MNINKTHGLFFIILSTYARCESSQNNQVQYMCYSQQKSTSLIKPFIISTTNGYILDCYVGYSAHDNDSTILLNVFQNDADLRNICLPKKTVLILDRGSFY